MATSKILEQLQKSLMNPTPNEKEEIHMIDQFIVQYATVYSLSGDSYKQILMTIVENRIKNTHWQYEAASRPHLLRVLQIIRILSREESLCQVFVTERGLEYLSAKLHEVTTQQRVMGEEAYQDDVCELLTEIISILYKTVNRMPRSIDPVKVVLSEDVCQDLQLLLGVKHNVLLRCVFECLLTLLEWTEQARAKKPDSKCSIQGHFCNSFVIDKLLEILEGFSDEFRTLAAETLTQLFKADGITDKVEKKEQLSHTQMMQTQDQQAKANSHIEIIQLFKALGGCEKLVGLLTSTSSEAVRARLLVCFQTLTSAGEDQDLLSMLKDLNIVPLLLEMLQQKNSAADSKKPVKIKDDSQSVMIASVLTTLTNLSLNDAANVKIRLNGAHIIGRVLCDNCPALNKDKKTGVYSEDPQENQRIQHELQLHCLRCLRFLYSVEKNRKAFKVVFPAEIYGTFIDVGNYNKEFLAYIPLLKKFNKRLPEEKLLQIRENLEQMGRFIKRSLATSGDKYVNGFKVLDLIGKGAYGSVYLVQKGENQYAMKEIPLTHFDVTPEQFQSYYESVGADANGKKSADDVIVEEICKEVAILKELNHPNIIKYHTSFADQSNIYIVMELLDGYSLADFILSQSEKKHRVREETIWSIFVQLCASLRYLHIDKRIVHRDLAPGNVLIDGDLKLKLADFGLAKHWGTQSTSVMKSFVGTILYSCPEIVQSQPYTEKADIWSLGCIIYELMTFTQPFSAGNPLTVAKKIVDGDCAPLTHEHYSPMLVMAVQACMTADPARRPNVVELCQLMVPVIMHQLDELRTGADQGTLEIKQLKDRLRPFEGTATTGFAFGQFKSQPSFGGAQGQLNNTILNQTQHIERGEVQNQGTEMKMVHVNQDNLKKLNSDPVASFLETVHKLTLITSLPPNLKKDLRQIQIENFYRAMFSQNGNGATIKNELLKLQNGSRDVLTVAGFNSCLKNMTYESLNQAVDDVLREQNLVPKKND